MIDPESAIPLNALLEAMPGGFNSVPGIVERRAVIDQMSAAALADIPANKNVVTSVYHSDDTDDGPGVEIRVYRPANNDDNMPCLGFIHGGGMIMGTLEGHEPICQFYCEALNVTVASIDYRKAPEDPYPAACNDVYNAVHWIRENAAKLRIDANNFGLIGLSAGGGLAIATALKIRDNGGPALKYLAPIYPMIDDRNTSQSSQDITDMGVWDRSGNIQAWEWYLGGKKADGYAAPARMENLSGLPPTFIAVGTMDLFRDENIEFAQRLMQAGVPTELKVYPGSYHASEIMAPQAKLSQRITNDRLEALRQFIQQG